MTISEVPGFKKRFQRTPWRFQDTFVTSLQELPQFVAAILSTHESLRSGGVMIDHVIFEPKHWKTLLSKHSLSFQFDRDIVVTATSPAEVLELLQAALTDSVDFIFVPTPKPFVIYADHDEYVTFFANTKSNLNHVSGVLVAHGFKKVQDYERKL